MFLIVLERMKFEALSRSQILETFFLWGGHPIPSVITHTFVCGVLNRLPKFQPDRKIELKLGQMIMFLEMRLFHKGFYNFFIQD